ncbi:hypothetical protein L195_g006056 [Trifolium pratense]|uniref:Chromo domain-containing protein n=1 Tax=Trifolium pratense TaxID=57577 RepID=A0A2K3P2N7_TRIPR|nr:hypothetical protein L195_g006056 [Trifolium pratense]
MSDDWQLEVGPEEAMDTRRNEQGEVEDLVKWKSLPDFENSWESVEKLKKNFQDSSLSTLDPINTPNNQHSAMGGPSD